MLTLYVLLEYASTLLWSRTSRADILFLRWVSFDTDFIVFSCSHCIRLSLGYYSAIVQFLLYTLRVHPSVILLDPTKLFGGNVIPCFRNS
jgi:hypothetical protein